MLKAFSLFLLVLFWTVLAQAVQNKTYPTAATTKIRVDTYTDEFSTTYKSTWTIEVGKWQPIIAMSSSSWTWINSSQTVSGYVGGFQGSTFSYHASTWTIGEYTRMIIEATKIHSNDESVNQDVEEYMVWPDTNCPSGWKGWANKVINGKNVAVACPQ